MPVQLASIYPGVDPVEQRNWPMSEPVPNWVALGRTIRRNN